MNADEEKLFRKTLTDTRAFVNGDQARYMLRAALSELDKVRAQLAEATKTKE